MKTRSPILSLLVASLSFGSSIVLGEPERDFSTQFGPEARTAYLQWRKARKNLDMAYLKKLEEVLESVTREGSLDEAVAIREEISRISRKHGLQEKGAPLAEYLVGTTWASDYNSATVTFEADGKAVRSMNGRETAIGYRIDGEKEFSILWTAAVGKAVMAEDRKSFKSGEATWTKK